jgi:glucan biosynthesis protein
MSNSEVPLVYTSKGNVPESTLKYQHQWIKNDEFIQFLEYWTDETGEVVKNNVHVYALKGGPSIGGQQALM